MAQQGSTAAAATAAATAGGSRKTGSGPTIDALTVAAQHARLVDDDGDGEQHALGGLDAATVRKLLLGQKETTAEDGSAGALKSDDGSKGKDTTQTEPPRIPSIQTWLRGRAWAQGGEAALMVGRRRTVAAETGDETAAGGKADEARGIDQGARPDGTMAAPEGVIHIDVDFTPDETHLAVKNIQNAASDTDFEVATIGFNDVPTSGGCWCCLLLRRVPANAQELLELRIAVIGNVDAGKSSTLGVLTRGGLDDGRGKARVNLFRHKHEIESGRTSSVGMEIMGFDAKGKIVMNYDPKRTEPGRKMSWEEICERSAKVLTFIDLAGHERYLKTTVGGLTGCLPDFVMLMVGANAGLIGMSKEHLGVALALAVPVLVCITKVDMTPPHILEATLKQLTKILRSPGCRKTPIFVSSPDQAIDAALRLGHERICPVFQISNVTGQNLDLLRSFLNVLPQADPAKFSLEAPFKFQLQDVFSVPFVGCVVSGVILSGAVRVGDNLIIGPDSLGQFTNTSVRSIQRKRVNVDAAVAGQSASFALKKIRRNQVRKGMVIMSKTSEGQAPPRAVMTCDAEVLCLYHSTTLSLGSCMVLHAASIRQTVRIAQIAKLDGEGRIISSTWTDRGGRNGDGGSYVNGKGRDSKKDAWRGAASAAGHGQNGSGQPPLPPPPPPSEKPVVRTGDRALLRLQFIRTAEYVEPGLKLITREGKTKLIGVVRSVGQTGPLSTDASPLGDAAASTSAAAAAAASPAPAAGGGGSTNANAAVTAVS